MKLTEKIEKLQEKNKGYVILIKSGIFFIAVGKDAVILNEQLGLKTTCIKDHTCKVGFPIKTVEKYIKTLNEKDVAYAIYLKNENDQIEELYRNDGKTNNEYRTCLDCKTCNNAKESDEDIIERIRRSGK